MNLPPSTFCEFPWESVLQKTEAEIVAVNIMKIRRRRGDVWPLTFAEYKAERLKDSGFSYAEEEYFKQVIPLIPDQIGAIAFSKTWADAARKAAKSA
jgi:hypothetical protein